jgi:cation diffusion facilitator family transporter
MGIAHVHEAVNAGVAGLAGAAANAAPVGPPAPAQAAVPFKDGDRRLYRIMLWTFFTLIPLTAMFIVMAVLTDSAAVVVYILQCAVALTVQAFSIYALRQVLRDDTFRFPYGAGKLEDFAAFLCGVLYIPAGLYVIYSASDRLVHPPAVGYLLGMVPILVETVRQVTLYVLLVRLSRRTRAPSPLLRAYLLDFRVGWLTDVGVFVAFATGWLLVTSGRPGLGDRVDPAIALAVAVYMLWVGVSLVRNSFRSLMDLPLPEPEQLRVLKALAEHYAEYEGIGCVYTRKSGSRQFVEIELAFPAQRTLAEIEATSARIRESLEAGVPGLRFRVVPVVEPGGAGAAQSRCAAPA